MMTVMILLIPIGTFLYNFIVGKPTEYGVGPNGILIVLVTTLVIHELMHGVGYLVAGIKPKYGVGMLGILPVLYTTTRQKTMMTVHQTLIAGYLPFIALSLALIAWGLVFPQHRQVTSFAFIINFAGSVGDLYIASKLWKYIKMKGIKVLDTKTGFEIYSS